MIATIAHRGPDACAVRTQPPIAFGHRRLSVIDLSSDANQPMADESGNYLLVYNGEIYNFRELRNELESAGARFKTASDSEVLIEAYKRWDLNCLERLNGMFAFALWDGPRQRLFLARDRAGEKPLYYCPLADGIVFASELKAVRRHPEVPCEIDAAALGEFLAINYVVGSNSLIKGVRRLEAGHYMIVDRGGIRPPVQYWNLAEHFRTKRHFRDENEAAEALAAELDRSVRLRLVSDVPLGAFLSGGIDSSSIVASVTRSQERNQTETFSIGFGESTYDELAWARFAADSIGVAHHHEQVVNADLAAALPQIVHAADEPMADSSIIPMYYLAKLARHHVTVCLSGDGGDEVLGGYETYIADTIHQRFGRFIPRPVGALAAMTTERMVGSSFDRVSFDYKLRRMVSAFGQPPARAHYSWRTIFTDEERRQLVRAERRREVLERDPFESFDRHFQAVDGCHYLDRAMYVDMKTWMADDILVKVDRMTMAHSLESRAPFLDHHLIEFCASLPVGLKVRGRTTKRLLKRSQEQRLPPTLIRRPKQGFNAPVSHWFAGAAGEVARAATSEQVLGEWLEPAAVQRLWDEHSSRRKDHGLKLFGLACLGLWLGQPA